MSFWSLEMLLRLNFLTTKVFGTPEAIARTKSGQSPFEISVADGAKHCYFSVIMLKYLQLWG